MKLKYFIISFSLIVILVIAGCTSTTVANNNPAASAVSLPPITYTSSNSTIDPAFSPSSILPSSATDPAFSPSPATLAADWLRGWANRIPLYVDHTKLSGPLTNFPVLVHLSSVSGINGADLSGVFTIVGVNSKRIAVTDAEGTSQCYVEIVKWDSVARQAYLWVRVPSVSNIKDTILYLYYDDSHDDNTNYVGDTVSTAAENVWDSNYKLVMHLAESGGTYKDSTVNHNDGVGGSPYYAQGSAPTRTADFTSGYAQQFNGSNSIEIPNPSDYGLSQPASPSGHLQIEYWVKPTALNFPGGDYIRIIGKGAASFADPNGGNQTEYQVVYYNGASSNPQNMTFNTYNPAGGQGAGCSVGVFPKGTTFYNVWSQVTLDMGPSSFSTYLNAGQLMHAQYYHTPDGESVHMVAGTGPLEFGTQWGGSDWFNGEFAEIRVSNIQRSNAWETASYYTEMDNLISYGSQVCASYLTANDTTGVGGNSWKGQSFIPTITNTVTGISLRLYPQGTLSGLATVFIYATEGGVPTGSPLVSSSIAASSISASGFNWVNFNFASGPILQPGTTYAWALSLPSGNSTNLLYLQVNTAGKYAGKMYETDDAGSSWVLLFSGASDLLFKEYGIPY